MAGRAWLLEYRVPISAALLVLSLASMFVLTSQSGSSFPTYLLAIYALVGWRRWHGLWRSGTFVLAAALALYLAASSFWSSPMDVRGAISLFVRALLTLCFVVAVAEGFRVDWFQGRMTAAIAICGGGAAAAALLVFFADPPQDGRLNGLGQLDSHVPAGLTFGVALVCALWWAFTAASAQQRAFAAAFALCAGLAVALSGSRNAWVAVAFGVATCLAGRAVRTPAGFAVAAGLAALVGVAALAALALSPLQGALLPRGDSYRLEIWAETLRRVFAHGPWFGNGALSSDDVMVDGFLMPHPHNMYLSVLFEGGAMGLVALLALIGASLKTLFAHFAEAEARLALSIHAIALPAWLIDGAHLVDKIGWTWMLFWLPLAIGIGLGSRSRLADAGRFSGGRYEPDSPPRRG